MDVWILIQNCLFSFFPFREAMTFREEVQKSAEVRFAMDVFHALNSNNFVRLFRLLRYFLFASC